MQYPMKKEENHGSADIPDDPKAKLMYFFDCICYCVGAKGDPAISHFQDYNNCSSLSSEEEAKLMQFCLELSPEKLLGKVLFLNERLDSGHVNEFFELSLVRRGIVAADHIVIDGQEKKIRKIMMFKNIWLEHYYHTPLRLFQSNRP